MKEKETESKEQTITFLKDRPTEKKETPPPPQDYSPILDAQRANVLEWARKPVTENEYFTFARLNSRAPFGAATLLVIMDRLSQLKNARYVHNKAYIEAMKEKDEKKRKKLIKEIEIDARDFHLDQSLSNDTFHEFIKKVFSGTVAVSGHRGKELLTTIKDMNRPQGGGMGFLAPLFGNKDVEPSSPEEIPILPDEMTIE